jgi:hypothetical protein
MGRRERLEGNQTSPHRLKLPTSPHRYNSGRLRRAGRFGACHKNSLYFSHGEPNPKNVKTGGSRE